MSETMSSPSSDWAKFYQQNLSGQAQTKPAALFTSNQATVTTNTTTSTSSSLSPEGRVAKPIRRRSRASRRTPTTLLNTDSANFRAMVQQFTGGPAGPFPSGSSNSLYPSGTNFNLGLGTSQQIVNPNAVMVPRAGYNNILQLQQQQQQQQQFQQQQYMLSMNNNNNIHNPFLERVQSSRVAPMMEVMTGGRFGMEGGCVSSSVPPIRSSSSNKNTGEDNYMFVRRT